MGRERKSERWWGGGREGVMRWGGHWGKVGEVCLFLYWYVHTLYNAVGGLVKDFTGRKIPEIVTIDVLTNVDF